MVGLTKNKRPIAYIVLIAVALASGARDATAVFVNSNSIVQDNIEYVMQTDKSIYNLGENVQILYGVINLTMVPVPFEIDVQQCSFQVSDGQTRICAWPKYVLPAFYNATLPPGVFFQFSDSWDLTNDNGTVTSNDDFLVEPGTYYISGKLSGMPINGSPPDFVTVAVQVVPEPATICLFGLGSLILLRKRGA